MNEEYCYALLEAPDEDSLSRLLSLPAAAIPARLVASPLHAIQAYRLARLAHQRGYARARLVALEALLYAWCASTDPSLAPRVDLGRIAALGPKPREPLVVVCTEKSTCLEAGRVARCTDPERVEWLKVPEEVALARTAVAMLEVERKRLLREGTV